MESEMSQFGFKAGRGWFVIGAILIPSAFVIPSAVEESLTISLSQQYCEMSRLRST
jgi:hypothetical protein